MSVVVFLYSKYSRGCEKLLEMMSVMDFRKICVDHDEVRKLVIKDDKKYNIQKVPCILVFFANGVMKKYEGSDAFDWVRDTMEKMKYISDATNPSTPSHQVAMTSGAMTSGAMTSGAMTSGMVGVPSRVEVPSQVGVVEVPSRVDVPSRVEVPSRPAPKQPSSSKLEPLFNLQQHSSPQEPIAVQPVGSSSSDISDLSDIPDMRRAMDSAPLPIQKLAPPKNTEGHSESGGNTNTNPMRGIKSDKQESIMSVAQQMQKQREKEDEVRNPNTV
jgi:hypothetical protein